MDIITIIGIISSILGIYSFLKNDTPLFKKGKKEYIILLILFFKKTHLAQNWHKNLKIIA